MPLTYPPFEHWVWFIPVVMLGLCVGSFLNVVIYRLPKGMSVNQPRRSFCPGCKNQLRAMQNLPVISWLCLGGKCGFCGVPISVRYVAVEILTAVLFGVVWWIFPPQVALPLWVLMALLVAITFIDAEHLIIPTNLTWAGAVVGLIGGVAWPPLSALAGYNFTRLDGLKAGGIGWIVGFVGLWGVVEFGKKAFGRRVMKFDKEVGWFLKEAEDEAGPMCFVIDEVEIPWWDIFSRKSDQLVIDATEVVVDGEHMGGGRVSIRGAGIELVDGRKIELETLVSLSGRATGAVIPREAMGMGDIHLLGMIGAFFGWSGVLFTLFGASLFAIFAAVVGRVGFGRQLPFGPFLALGGVVWMLGGWRLWQGYVEFLGF